MVDAAVQHCHQDRCGHRSGDKWRSSATQERAELEVQKLEGAGTDSNTPARSSNRSNVSMGVCWCRGYSVLGVVVLWLVVPTEAASGGATALAGAAVAATAAGVGAAVNYWAAMENETAGNIKVLSKRN